MKKFRCELSSSLEDFFEFQGLDDEQSFIVQINEKLEEKIKKASEVKKQNDYIKYIGIEDNFSTLDLEAFESPDFTPRYIDIDVYSEDRIDLTMICKFSGAEVSFNCYLIK